MKILRRKLHSAGRSLNAIVFLLREEASFQFLAICVPVVVGLSVILQISHTEWIAIVLSIGFVLAIEAFNTAIEELCDHVTMDQHPQIGKIKDLAAAASAIAITTAFMTGLIVFIPHIAGLL